MPCSRRVLVASVLLALPLPVLAQGAANPAPVSNRSPSARTGERAAPAGPADPTLARAYTLVINGDGEAGRRVVDSVLAVTPSAGEGYAEALYWRAAFAANVTDAQRDYRRLSTEFPLSARAADALIALAQLEYVRGDRKLSVHHLQRLMVEHPAGVRSARANFWAARVLFDAGDPARACAALRAARATAGADEAELRNQVEAEIPKCSARRVTLAASPGMGKSAPRRAGAERTAERTAEARERAGSATAPRSANAAGAAHAAGYSVQVAAYGARRGAEELVIKLAARGYDARVVGGTAPYRVRVGRYPSRGDAAATLSRMQGEKLGGLVVPAEPR